MRTAHGSDLARRTLRANAAVTAMVGIALIAFARPLSRWLGVDAPLALGLMGVLFVLCAVGVWRNSRRVLVDETELLVIAVLDAGWVVASAVLIAAGPLSTAGNWAVALSADITLLFAVLELTALRWLRRGPREAWAGLQRMSEFPNASGGEPPDGRPVSGWSADGLREQRAPARGDRANGPRLTRVSERCQRPCASRQLSSIPPRPSGW